MKIVFVSNYFNHHQLAISQEFLKYSEYYFIATEEFDVKRLNLGYKDMNSAYDFVVRAYESEEMYKQAIELINSADVVIFGGLHQFKIVEERVKDKKLTFAYSERLFKNKKLIRMLYPKTILYFKKNYVKYKNNQFYLLCASAYSKSDYNWFGAFKDKCYKWGYFPKIESFDDTLDEVVESKNKENEILWCGRFIDWKHPEYAVECAKYLKSKNIKFHITMVGAGEMVEHIKKLVKKNKVEEYVSIIGSLPFDKVQEKMKQAKVFLFTSDQNEGWGAVLNESMGNACCVVANRKIGSVPYMLNNENGYIYRTKKEFLTCVYDALTNENTKEKCKSAYKTIHEIWNAEIAVKNFLLLVENIINEQNNEIIGPASKDCN